jgi:hypothetical protein
VVTIDSAIEKKKKETGKMSRRLVFLLLYQVDCTCIYSNRLQEFDSATTSLEIYSSYMIYTVRMRYTLV